MTTFLRVTLALGFLLFAGPVLAGTDTYFDTPGGGGVNGALGMCLNTSNKAVPCNAANVVPSAVSISPYPTNPVTGVAATPITGNATGTTGAVVGTLAAAAGKTTYICGLHVDATGTGAIGPITIANLVGSNMVMQATAGGVNGASQVFTPCIPANAANTAITITTTANASATAVDVNSWGFQY
ncbi:hypothetical protein ACRAVF_27225 [Bradyrhizobium oligotrophicum S58]